MFSPVLCVREASTKQEMTACIAQVSRECGFQFVIGEPDEPGEICRFQAVRVYRGLLAGLRGVVAGFRGDSCLIELAVLPRTLILINPQDVESME